MKSYFNDSPIENSKDDRYGVTPFADALAKSILNISRPIGTTIALHGPWGSGKSSVVNLVRSALARADGSKLVVTDFKCWWYRGEEALALAFLQNLNAVLGNTLKGKVKGLVPKLGRDLLQAGPIIGSAVAFTPAAPLSNLIGGTFDFAKRYFPEGNTLEVTFQQLAKALQEKDRRFLVIIDDIDRLNPEEALGIFRLVKSIGRLPNVMYLLVFDRQLAEKAVQDRYPSEGPHFLEKIIQAGFELPTPLPVDLNNATLTSISEICGTPKEDHIVRFMNVFYDVVAPYITSPRHVCRLQNAISVTWPAIASEVNLADFIALETLRLYEPTLFTALRANKQRACGVRHASDPDCRGDNRFDIFVTGVPEDRRDLVKTALQRLFPRLEETGYGSEWIREWDMERRVCVETHFDTYFRLSLSEEALSSHQIDDLIERADESEHVKETLLRAATTERRTGQSMVPVYLDELTTHGKRIPKQKVEPLISALFEIHDEIDHERDDEKGFMAVANTTLRYHWLIRSVTRDRFSIEERTAAYMKATENASLGWMVDFVVSACSDYQEREGRGPTREADCLTTRDALDELKNRALEKIRSAAADGSLLLHRDLLFILYRWVAFLDSDPSEVRAWTEKLLADEKALIILARAMTGRSWSTGLGGFGNLGDRVARPSVVVHIDDETIIDANAFHSALEKILNSGHLGEDEHREIQEFLDAWDRKRDDRGKD